MRIVFAGTTVPYRELIEYKAQNFLASQYYDSDIKTVLLIAKELNKENIRPTLIIDSGAFSAWSKGRKIHIDKYLQFIRKFEKDNGDLFSELYFVNLDVIPGRKGDRITKEMAEESAKLGFQNYYYLRDNGIKNIIHVYHQAEDVKWLKKMIAEGMNYIGISPSNDEQTQSRCRWLEYVFKFVPSEVKVHGFAVTSPRLMIRYPWFSVDSVSYVFSAAMGSFMFCKPSGLECFRYSYSERLNDLPRTNGEREYIQGLLFKIDPSFDLEQIRISKTRLRVKVNIKTFLELERRINEKGHLNKHLESKDLFV